MYCVFLAFFLPSAEMSALTLWTEVLREEFEALELALRVCGLVVALLRVETMVGWWKEMAPFRVLKFHAWRGTDYLMNLPPYSWCFRKSTVRGEVNSVKLWEYFGAYLRYGSIRVQKGLFIDSISMENEGRLRKSRNLVLTTDTDP